MKTLKSVVSRAWRSEKWRLRRRTSVFQRKRLRVVKSVIAVKIHTSRIAASALVLSILRSGEIFLCGELFKCPIAYSAVFFYHFIVRTIPKAEKNCTQRRSDEFAESISIIK